MRVTLTFKYRFEPWMKEGIMEFTPRLKPLWIPDKLRNRYREPRPGDHFRAFGEIFDITFVDRDIPLGWVAQRGYRQAGHARPEDFIAFWNEIHPHRGYRETDRVRLYWFALRDATVAKTVRAKNWCPYCPYDAVPHPEHVCEHFMGFAGEAQGDIGIYTPVSVRIYREKRKDAVACPATD